jgi:hypothetical protein
MRMPHLTSASFSFLFSCYLTIDVFLISLRLISICPVGYGLYRMPLPRTLSTITVFLFSPLHFNPHESKRPPFLTFFCRFCPPLPARSLIRLLHLSKLFSFLHFHLPIHFRHARTLLLINSHINPFYALIQSARSHPKILTSHHVLPHSLTFLSVSLSYYSLFCIASQPHSRRHRFFVTLIPRHRPTVLV